MTVKQAGGEIPIKVWDKKSSDALAKEAVSAIVDRAFNKGRDVNDKIFKPYSPSSKNIGKVDLVDTGRLKNSLEIIKSDEDGFLIATSVPYAGFVNDFRQFMGLSDGDINSLKNDIEKNIKAAMARSTK